MSDQGQRDVGAQRDRQRVNGLDDRPAVRFDRVLPVAVALVADVADLEQVVPVGIEGLAEERVGEEVVVRAGERAAVGAG